MTLEEFINEHLCSAGVVTAWDAQVITTKITELTGKAGIRMPVLFSKENTVRDRHTLYNIGVRPDFWEPTAYSRQINLGSR